MTILSDSLSTQLSTLEGDARTEAVKLLGAQKVEDIETFTTTHLWVVGIASFLVGSFLVWLL